MEAYTWNPVVLPGVTDWSDFDWAYYLDKRTVTADRVLPDTFYLYYVSYSNHVLTASIKAPTAAPPGAKYSTAKSQPSS